MDVFTDLLHLLQKTAICFITEKIKRVSSIGFPQLEHLKYALSPLLGDNFYKSNPNTSFHSKSHNSFISGFNVSISLYPVIVAFVSYGNYPYFKYILTTDLASLLNVMLFGVLKYNGVHIDT